MKIQNDAYQSMKSDLLRGVLAMTLLLLMGIGMVQPAQAQTRRIGPIGTWTPYVSHFAPIDLVRKGDVLFLITEGGMFIYDTKTERTRGFSPVEGLSDVSPSAIYHDSTSGMIFIGYDNGMVNYFNDITEDIEYLTDIERTELFTTKRINNFASYEELLYIGTEFGIVIFDIEKQEVRSSVTKIADNPSGSPVRDLCIVDDTIYVSMGARGVAYASIHAPNITVPDVWTRATGFRNLPTGESNLITFVESEQTVWVVVNDTIYNKPPASDWVKTTMPNRKYHYLHADGDYLKMGYDNLLRIKAVGLPQYNVVHTRKVLTAWMDSTIVYIGDDQDGLMVHHALDSVDVKTPEGPYNNLVTRIAAGNGEFYIAPEGRSGTAPANNFDGFYHFHPDRGWNRFNVDDELYRDSVYAEFARAYYHEEDRRCFMGSWNHGVLELTDGEITGAWTPKNSNLSGSGNNGDPDHIRVSGLAVDRDGNLWASGMLADNNLNVLSADTREWTNYRVPGTNPLDLLIDDWGNKWMINLASGLSVFSENGTIDDASDDQWKLLTADANNGGLPSSSVFAMAKDLKGHIWVGTLEGVAVFASPGSVFSGNMSDASCPVIDGFCLLRDQRVSAIAVDGANRKWLGTNNGVYVVNPQGNRLVQHYTTENSPLFSDEIRAITIDQASGEIFIGTAKGVISLIGDAVAGKETSEDLYVFPNPIDYEYEGTVAISCSVRDAEVRITDAAGRLVRSLDALGGQAVWDFRDAAGNRLKPGIYLAMVADSDGKNAGVAKFAVLERR